MIYKYYKYVSVKLGASYKLCNFINTSPYVKLDTYILLSTVINVSIL